MFTRETLKNKIFALAIIILGVITILISGDATFFIFALIPGLYLFFSKENWIYILNILIYFNYKIVRFK